MSDRRPTTREDIPLRVLVEDMRFGDYWPHGSPDLVRRFLVEEYDRDTMPALQLARDPKDGTLWCIGWANSEHPDGISLLEAARGYAMTDEEADWARSPMALLRSIVTLERTHHRKRRLRDLGRGDG